MSPFMTIVDIIGIWLGIIGAIFSFWTWLYAHRFFLKSKKPQISANKGDAALIFNLTGRSDITDQVKEYMGKSGELCGKILNSRHLDHGAAYGKINSSIFNVKASAKGRMVTICSEKSLNDENVGQYIEDYRRIINQLSQYLRADGVKKIHLFYSGPSVLCALIGAETKNSFQLSLYHFNATSGYLYIGDMVNN